MAEVDDFGADDMDADGEAIEAAIAAASAAGGGAVLLGPGRYILQRRVLLPPGVVLRGSGRDATTVDIPLSLQEVYGGGDRAWSFGGAFFYANGRNSFEAITTIQSNAARGERTIEVPDAAGIAVGDWIVVRQDDVGGALIRRLHADLVRDVTIQNADYGVSFTYSFICTATGVILERTGDRGEVVGHHGLNNGHGGDNLFVDFDIRARFVHDLTNEWYAHGVVFARGRGEDLCMDLRQAVERPRRRRAQSLDFPAADYGPRMTFVGFATDQSLPDGHLDWYFDETSPAELEPANLWEAMRAARLGVEPMDAGVSDAGPGSDAAAADASGAGDSSVDAGGDDGGCSLSGGSGSGKAL
ncbi:MAG: hypothetical protein ACI9KE_005845, partial [Polyangiales bacterium]